VRAARVSDVMRRRSSRLLRPENSIVPASRSRPASGVAPARDSTRYIGASGSSGQATETL
jgi:hypothetical protein